MDRHSIRVRFIGGDIQTSNSSPNGNHSEITESSRNVCWKIIFGFNRSDECSEMGSCMGLPYQHRDRVEHKRCFRDLACDRFKPYELAGLCFDYRRIDLFDEHNAGTRYIQDQGTRPDQWRLFRMGNQIKGLTINTILTGVTGLLVAVLGFFGTEMYKKVYAMNETVAVIQATLVSRVEFEQLKVKILELQQKQDSMSLEIRRLKQHP